MSNFSDLTNFRQVSTSFCKAIENCHALRWTYRIYLLENTPGISDLLGRFLFRNEDYLLTASEVTFTSSKIHVTSVKDSSIRNSFSVKRIMSGAVIQENEQNQIILLIASISKNLSFEVGKYIIPPFSELCEGRHKKNINKCSSESKCLKIRHNCKLVDDSRFDEIWNCFAKMDVNSDGKIEMNILFGGTPAYKRLRDRMFEKDPLLESEEHKVEFILSDIHWLNFEEISDSECIKTRRVWS